MSKFAWAALLTAALGISGVLVASAEASPKKDACVTIDIGHGVGLVLGNGHAKRVRAFAGALALAAVHSGAYKDMDSAQLSDYVIDVAKRVAYADYEIDDPVDPNDPTDALR